MSSFRTTSINPSGRVASSPQDAVRGAGTSPLLTSLVSYWSLEEASGVRADAYGANALTDNNTVTQAVGKIGSAAQFVAANSESLSRADNADLSMGDIDFTLACWLYLDSKGANRSPLGKFDVSSNQREYRLVFNNAGDRLHFVVSSDGSASTTLIAATLGAPALATWYFVVAWHNSVANTVNIQINDGVVDSTAHSTGVFDGASAFRIGAPGGTFEFWDGRVDEAAIWKRVLATAERTFLYNSGNGRSFAEIQAYRG